MSAYKKYYCLLCRGLQFHYGTISRFLLSYDVAFFMAFLDDKDTFHSLQKIRCLKKTLELTDACKTEFVKKTAALNILFAAGKLDDDKIDDRDFKAFIAQWVFNEPIKKAKKDFPKMWEIIKNEYDNIRHLEQENRSLEEIENAFATMLYRIVNECFNISDEYKLKMLKSAASWLYFIDAVDDLDENIKKGTFNPLLHMESFYILKNSEYKNIADHFRSLYNDYPTMSGEINAAIINRVLYFGMPETMIRIMTRKGKK